MLILLIYNNSHSFRFLWLWIIYQKYIDILIFLILLEITGDFHIGNYLYCIYIIHIDTTRTFLHSHFISSHAVLQNLSSMSYLITLNESFFILYWYIIKRWWYFRRRLFKSERWCHSLKDDYPWQEPNWRCSKLLAFKYLDCKLMSQLPAAHYCTMLRGWRKEELKGA